MEELKKRKTTRLASADYNRNQAVFLTICTKERKCILSRVVGTGVLDGPHIELTKFGQIADKYIHQLNDFYEDLSVESYVIMPNHIHVMLWIRGTENGPSRTPVPTVQNSVPSRFVSAFKRFCNKEYGENIWQYRSNIISSATVKIMKNIYDTFTKILFVGTTTNYTQNNRGMGFAQAFVIQMRNWR